MWENIGIKNQKVKNYKPLIFTSSTIGIKIKNIPDDLTITPWREMKGLKDEKLFKSILSHVK